MCGLDECRVAESEHWLTNSTSSTPNSSISSKRNGAGQVCELTVTGESVRSMAPNLYFTNRILTGRTSTTG
jgi:hypothetical protein